MAVSTADMNQIRVDVLGTTVDNPGATWTTFPPNAANTLNTTQRIINRAINELDQSLASSADSVNGFAGRFNGVVGDEEAADGPAFNSLGMNLIQAVAALIAAATNAVVASAVEEFPAAWVGAVGVPVKFGLARIACAAA